MTPEIKSVYSREMTDEEIAKMLAEGFELIAIESKRLTSRYVFVRETQA